MFKTFFPDLRTASAYKIPYERFYEQGYRGIIFDIDNTLVEHGADADERAVALFSRLERIGYKTCLLSNNGEERVLRFNRDIGSYYIYKAGKPGKKSYFKAMELMGTELSTTFFVGDQLFTDVWGAKRIHMKNILVNKIGPKEEIQIVLKRYLERIVLYFYEKEKRKNEG